MNKKIVMAFLNRYPQKRFRYFDLSKALKVGRSKQRTFKKLLFDLVGEGLLIKSGQFYRLAGAGDYIEGVVSKHPKGFAFVISEDPSEEDVFLNQFEAKSLMNKDRVRVSVREDRGRRSGQLIEIVERGQRRVVGRLISDGKHFFIVPHGADEGEQRSSRVF